VRLLKWLFQPVYLLLIIVIVALYVNRDEIFPKEVAESLEAKVLVAKIGSITEGLREEFGDALGSIETGPQEERTSESETIEEVVVAPIEEVATAPVNSEMADPAHQPVQVVENEAIADTTPDASSAEPTVGSDKVDAPDTVVAENSATTSNDTIDSKPIVMQSPVADVAAEPISIEPPVESIQSESTISQSPAAAPAPVLTQIPVISVAPAPSFSTAPVDSRQTQTQSPLVVWRQARSSVWQGDLDSAVSHYRQLISQQPENYDAYGEMGNVLLAQSRVDEATQAYAIAARLIYRSGNREIAYRVVDIVRQLDSRQAENLRREFTQ